MFFRAELIQQQKNSFFWHRWNYLERLKKRDNLEEVITDDSIILTWIRIGNDVVGCSEHSNEPLDLKKVEEVC